MTNLYRAVPKNNFNENQIYKAKSTKRPPSNIPYIIDNIWECLRPDYFPSRRFSIYASPTPELALENASSVGYNKNDYIVCQLIVNKKDIKIAHIPVKDARNHSDISNIMRYVINNIGDNFSDMNIKDKIKHGALFLPTISKEELMEYFNNSNNDLYYQIKKISTFWSEAKKTPQNHNGELFFELLNNSTYSLIKI